MPTDKPAAPPAPATTRLSPAQTPGRFALLCLASFGLYELVWFYRNWRWLAEKQGLRVWPAARALLAPLYSFSLFDRVYTLSYEKGIPVFRFPQVFAGAYLLLIVARAYDPISKLALAAFVPLLPVVRVLNAYWAKEDPGASPRTGFSRGEKVLLAVAVPFWILRIIWELLPD